MAVTDLFAGEITTELLKQLLLIAKKSALCRTSADQLANHLTELLPIMEEIKYSGVELPQNRQAQLDRFSESLQRGRELCVQILASRRWNLYKHMHLARKLEKLEKEISRFMQILLPLHALADIHHLRFESAERFDQLEALYERIEQRLGATRIGVDGGGWLQEETMMRMEELGRKCEDNLVNLGEGMETGVREVKKMVIERGDLDVVGICGIGGSGKTSLARRICRDELVRSHFKDRILFLTVSQSPNVEALRSRIWQFLSGTSYVGRNAVVPQWNLQYEWNIESRSLVVLDDVWSLAVLQQLVFKRVPGCKMLVVSRFRFPSEIKLTYDMELLKGEDAVALFCSSAFGQTSVPVSADEQLVKQLVSECKGLPLALKVIGASLRDQHQICWVNAKNRLSRGEAISEFHETNLLERMKISISYLPEKVKECFLDLASFPEDKKIPLDVLINMWVEVRDLDEEEAFAILLELAEKNLVTLVRESRAGDLYSSYLEIYVTQHDVLRDLALYMSDDGDVCQRKRLLMPRREERLPKEWERLMDQPFNALIVSLHTGEMQETSWFPMQFPKAEVLVLNFSSSDYFLPPFISSMPKLRAMILINNSTSHAVLHNRVVFANMPSLRSLWFERIFVPRLPETTIPLSNMRKISLILCKMDTTLDSSVIYLPRIVPHLTELTLDHCIDLTELAPSICKLIHLKSLSITNCHSLQELPSDLNKLCRLEILRINSCPSLKKLPQGICRLDRLKYLDVAECVNLVGLPEDIDNLTMLEKIDMRGCSQVRSLPKSAKGLQSLRHVVCDEEIQWLWKEVGNSLPRLHLQVAEECFSLDWLMD